MMFSDQFSQLKRLGSGAGQFLQSSFRSRSVRQAGWVVSGNVISQFLRLLTNIILTRLLAPQLFGIMVIVNSVRTGIELLSDVGIGQNVVRHREGDQLDFLSTAWTVQVIRGAILTILGLILAYPIAVAYGEPILASVFAAASTTFFINGLISPGRFLLQRRQNVKTLSLFEIGIAIMNLLVHVVAALLLPTIWGLVIALLVSTTIGALLSGLLLPWSKLTPQVNRDYFRDIISFGKWLLLSSFIFFAAMNFDRLYLASVLPLAILGIYGVARSLSDAFTLLSNRACSLLVFPKVADAHNSGNPVQPTITPARWRALLPVAIGLAFAISFSDRLVLLLYDSRYHAAAFMLPILMAGVWFTILATVNEAILMGISRPASTAIGNGAKLIWVCIGVPLSMTFGSFEIALIVISIADLVRYFVLSVSQLKVDLSFFRQDAFLTVVLILAVWIFRSILSALGIVPELDMWWTYGESLR